MDKFRDLAGLLACTLVLAALGECRVEWSQSEVKVNQGDNVTITCSTTVQSVLDVVRIFWQDANNPDGQIAISDNKRLKKWFNDTERYSATQENDPGNNLATLRITYTRIRGEDAGTIGCYNLDKPDEKAYMQLNVKVPIKELYLTTQDMDNEYRLVNGDNVHLRQGVKWGVACVANVDGSKTPPNIQLLLGGKRDVTAHFRQEVTSPPEPTSNHQGLLPRSVTVKRVYETLHPSPDYNNMELRCRAGQLSVFANVQVEYAPTITCDDYDKQALQGQSVTFTCYLKSNPGSHIEWFYVNSTGEHWPIESVQPEETITTHNSILSADHTQLLLSIPEVEDHHFTRYVLKAKNNYGEKEIDIVLNKGSVEIVIPTEKPTTVNILETDIPTTHPMKSAKSEEPQTDAEYKHIVETHEVHDAHASTGTGAANSLKISAAIFLATAFFVTSHVVDVFKMAFA